MREARRNGGEHEKEVCRDERGARREEKTSTSREDKQRRSSRSGERKKLKIDASEGHRRQRYEKESRGEDIHYRREEYPETRVSRRNQEAILRSPISLSSSLESPRGVLSQHPHYPHLFILLPHQLLQNPGLGEDK